MPPTCKVCGGPWLEPHPAPEGVKPIKIGARTDCCPCGCHYCFWSDDYPRYWARREEERWCVVDWIEPNRPVTVASGFETEDAAWEVADRLAADRRAEGEPYHITAGVPFGPYRPVV